jgi:hypothetical protein
MKFAGGKVVAGFQKRAQNGVALAGLFQPDLPQMAVQNVLRLPHHLAGNGRLIVNALLQHWR